MKTLFALTALFVATTPLIRAQEEPSPTPEATAAEKSASPAEDTSVSVTTEKAASPAAKKSSLAPSASASPSAKSKPAASPVKSASPAATVPAKKGSVEATLKDLENRWEGSIPSHDPSVAQSVLADDFVGVTSKGKLLNKSGILSEIKKDTDTYTSATNGRMDVRVFGAQFAVVSGSSTEVGKDKDGKAFNRSFRWTDTWVERNNKWQCVASQANLISK